jgi:cellulose synthase/poly-beta-1,6-N-acetylglucosamine synthase-like glycosyltransferase
VSEPAAAIAVSTHERPLRLRWLLNALSEQTREDFELIVAHDSSSPETEQLLRTHPLAHSGRLRHLSFAAGSVLPGAKRNAAWRAARAPLILFTDDDCRPNVDWVQRAVALAMQNPGAILQGMTIPDPDETAVLRGAPWAHTVLVEPPTVWAETCNIAYPREVLARVGGFDEELRVGEDADLAVRALDSGARIVAAREMLVYHAVEEQFLPATLRSLGPPQSAPAHVGPDLVEARARRPDGGARRSPPGTPRPAGRGARAPMARTVAAPSGLWSAGHRPLTLRAARARRDRRDRDRDPGAR